MANNSKYGTYFEFIDGRAVCKLCPPQKAASFKFEKGCSTSGLKWHLLREHDRDVGRPKEDQNALVELLLECILHHDLPFAIVECPCFRHFVDISRRCPDDAVPCVSSVQDYLHQRYLRELEALRQKLSNKPSLCLQLDHWTSAQERSYVGILESHVDGKFHLCYNMLDFAVDPDHCSEITFCTVDSIRMGFGIKDSQICGAVGDATNSMKRALRLISDALPESIPHLCFSHVLQRALVTNYECVPEIQQLHWNNPHHCELC